jgi:hypothetical protein
MSDVQTWRVHKDTVSFHLEMPSAGHAMASIVTATGAFLDEVREIGYAQKLIASRASGGEYAQTWLAPLESEATMRRLRTYTDLWKVVSDLAPITVRFHHHVVAHTATSGGRCGASGPITPT